VPSGGVLERGLEAVEEFVALEQIDACLINLGVPGPHAVG
jgi:hypothetical protein